MTLSPPQQYESLSFKTQNKTNIFSTTPLLAFVKDLLAKLPQKFALFLPITKQMVKVNN